MAEKNASQSSLGGAVYWIGGLVLGLLIAGVGLYVMPRSDSMSTPEPSTVTEPVDKPAPVVASPGAKTVAPDQTGSKTETEATSIEPVVDPDPISEPPAFDTVRAEADGSVVVAGRTTPQESVAVLVDGVESVTVTADDNGNFVALFDLPPSALPRVLTLMGASDAGTAMMSEESVIIAPITAPVAVAEATSSAVSDQNAGETGSAGTGTAGTAESSSLMASIESLETTGTSGAKEIASAAPVEPAATGNVSESLLQTPPESSGPQTAPDAPAALSAPEAPAVLIVDASGVRKPTVATPVQSVVIDTIGYDLQGQVKISGRGSGKGFIRLYLNNGDVATTPMNEDGSWSISLSEVKAGLYTLRVDQIDAAGKVTSRFEIPFLREDPDKVVAALAAPEKPEPAKTAPTAAQPTTPEQVPATTLAQTQTSASGSSEAPVAEITAKTTPDPAPVPELSAVAISENTPETTQGIALPAEPSSVALPTQVVTRASIITVQPGFTLWGIASENYGNGFLYVKVYEANKEQIRDPDLIYPGQIFTVPQ
ncbi:MAG: LysM peptidoglycan-binding domain-containing protein [Albidovulum sp.]